ncbi:putative extracellular serine carboxypeptidase [Lachnellula willkommii]|uniref:Putative extracellular serine carboxypeptidase n=1 Tax=Lachnellula willkommii TaxID=215461 RepID=A0A559MIC1_9HELO|nr:putative extracellular serine carboxypeptidase [Lachnellula willkommii]
MKLNLILPTLAIGFLGSTTGLTTRNPNGLQLAPRQSSPYPPNTFDQIIDHYPSSDRYKPHANGTFTQRYFFDSTYYKSGGPVFLYIGGETTGESRFSNLQTGSIADNAYFAQHATFPGVSGNLTAPGTPWILYGGSLAGAQTAYTMVAHGDVLYAGIGSSATVVGLHEYPEWYDPIQKFGPQDCISSINGIIAKIDSLVASNNTAAIQELKGLFGLEDLEDIRDFAMTIAFPIGGPMNYPTSTWQELNWNPAYSADDFWNFCSNVTNIDAPAEITAVDTVLSNYSNGQPWTGLGNYANYFKEVVLPGCESGDVNSPLNGCFGTQNPCTEQGAYQVAPKSGPALIMNVLQVDYTQQWCTWAFPRGKYNSIPSSPDLDRLNTYGSYNLSANRLALVDGGIDPWLDICVHSKYAPARESTDLRPAYLIAGAGHHWDSYGILNVSAEPLFIQQTHLFEIKTVRKWLRAFKPSYTHSEL